MKLDDTLLEDARRLTGMEERTALIQIDAAEYEQVALACLSEVGLHRFVQPGLPSDRSKQVGACIHICLR